MTAPRIRFAPVKCGPTTDITTTDITTAAITTCVSGDGSPEPARRIRRSAGKSRSGCRECKTRRVKCDETFPWQMELPWLSTLGMNPPATFTWDPFHHISFMNKKLLQQWFETTSRIMVVDHGQNPLSFPILTHLSNAPSLAHIIQSISAAYQHFFQHSKLNQCLEERSKAMSTLRTELQHGGRPLMPYLLTTYLLGLSSSFIDEDFIDYGKEHFFAFQARTDPLMRFVVGAYVYWSLTCSTLVDPAEQEPPSTSQLDEYITNMGDARHPITGRHCRAVVEGGHRDAPLEQTFEQQLLEWTHSGDDIPWDTTANAFRYHGLLMLHRVCSQNVDATSPQDHAYTFSTDNELKIKEYATQTIKSLSSIPIDSPLMVLQPIPLMTAGAELTKDDGLLRATVIERFQALSSFNRLPANLRATQLLQELWELKDMGVGISWLELMLLKNWRLRLG
ncbi:hypothetical protein EDB80DRAFT_749734 [Ilyonectria destructans]|nr:hypothetical protein EDB80DRAFT_749734 [Ilyonectria destructans]